MTREQKDQIIVSVIQMYESNYVIKKGKKEFSQEKTAIKLGVSGSYINSIVNKKDLDKLSDEMWRKIKVKLKVDFNWKTAQTTNLKNIYKHAEKAKEKSISFAISHDAGAGKSQAYKLIASTLPNVIHIECKTFWKSKTYAKALVTACGLKDNGTAEELVERFIDHLSTLDKPLIIIDQMDKLKDGSMDFFIDFYNDLVGHCGFLLSGVPALKKRINRGVTADRTGYCELWSRIGRKYLTLKPLSLLDVKAICIENGLNDPQRIEIIFNNAEGDLRRVKQDVENYFLNQKIT